MKQTFKILTRKKEGQSHRETKVTIDWSGVSKEDLMVLAKSAIVADLQARIQREMIQFPAEITLDAKELLHRDSVALWQYQPPKPKVNQKLIEALKSLTPEELKELLLV